MKLKILQLILSLFFVSYSFSSDFIINYKAVDITACGGPVTFEVSIVNTSGATINNFTLDIDQMNNLNYIGGTVTTLTEGTIANYNQPIFLYNTPLNTGDSVTFTYQSEMDCNTNGTFQGTNDITISYGGLTYNETSTPYNILFPVVSLANTIHVSPPTYSGYIGDQFTRQIQITNSGTGFLTEFYFIDAHGSSITMIISPGTQYTNGGVDSVHFDLADFNALGYPNGLPPGQSIYLSEIINLIECTDFASNNPEGLSNLSIHAVCNGQVCQSAGTTAQVIVTAASPNLRTRAVVPRPVCYGPNNQYQNKLIIENTGLGEAKDVLFFISHSGNGNYTYMVPGTFRVLDSNNNPVAFNDSAIYYPTTSPIGSGCVPGSIRRNYVTIPSIKPGETLEIIWDVKTCCESKPCGDQQTINNLRYELEYSFNQCLGNLVRRNTGVSYTSPYVNNSGSVSYSGESGIAPFGTGDSLEMSYKISSLSIWPGDTSGTICFELEFNDFFFVAEDFYILKNNGDSLLPSSISFVPGNPNVYMACFPIESFPNPVFSSHNSVPWGGSIDNLDWEAKFSLSANCPVGEGPFFVNMDMTYTPSQNCPDNCKFLLDCYDLPLLVSCPGCLRQGIHNNKFSAKRINFGLPDNNNDGIPDNNGVLDFSRIKTKKVMVGDTIETKLECEVIINGIYAPYPFIYGDSLKYAYAYTTGADYITPISYKVEFTEALTSNTYVIQLPKSTTYKQGARYFLDYSIDTLHKYGLPLSISRFHNGDLVNIYSYFKVTGNVGINNVSTGNLFQKTVLGCIQGYDNLVEAVSYEITDSNHQDNIAWRCYNHIPTNMTYVGYRMLQRVETDDNVNIDNTCNRYVFYRYIFMVGDKRTTRDRYAGNNAFPFEYRVWNFPKEIKFVPPFGFDYKRSRVSTLATSFSNTNNVIGDAIDTILYDYMIGDTLVFNIDQYFSEDSAAINNNDSLLFKSDDDFSFYFYSYLQPRCYTPSDSMIDYEFKSTLSLLDSWGRDTAITNNLDSYIFREDLKYLPYLNTDYTDINISLDNISNRRNVDNILFYAPVVETEAALPSVSGIDREVCWDVKLENKTNRASASNVWIAYYSPSGNISINGIYNANNMNPFNDTNGIFQLGNLTRNGRSGDSRDLRICATYSCNPSPDSVFLLTGWDCADYPSDISSYPCKIDTTILYVYPELAAMQAVLTNQPSADICSPISTELFINVSDVGTIYDVNVDVIYPNGITFVSGSATLEYPVGNTPVSIPNASNFGIYIKWIMDSINNTIQANGIPGGARDPLNNSLYLRFDSETDCNYQSTLPIDFRISGINNCGDSTQILLSQPIDINGRDTLSRITQRVTYNNFQNCDTSTLVKIKLINAGANQFNGSESYSLKIPNGINISPFNFTNNTLVYDSSNNLGGYSEYFYSIPVGIITGDSIVFTFNASTSLCGNYNLISIPKVYQNLYCATTTNFCTSSIDLDYDTIMLSKGLNNTNVQYIDTLCLGDTVNYYYPAVCDGTHEWYLNGTLVSNDSIYQDTLTNVGQHNILYVYNKYCGADSILHQIMINSIPLVNLVDTTICNYDSTFIDITDPAIASYYWNDLDSNSSRWLKPGYYWVDLISADGCLATDSVSINTHPVHSLQLIDTGFCVGDSVLLSKDSLLWSSYLWNDGILVGDRYVSDTGIYTLEVIDTNGCYLIDSVNIQEYELPVLSTNDTSFCKGQSLTLNYTNASYTTYKWNDGDSVGLKTFTNAGLYWLEVTNANGCLIRDTFGITIDSLPILSMPNDTILCIYDSLSIDITNASIVSYLWSDLDVNPTKTVHNGLYWVEVTDVNSCVNRDTINISNHLQYTLNLLDGAVCENDSLFVQYDSIIWGAYVWSDSLTIGDRYLIDTGMYSLQVVDTNGCSVYDTMFFSTYPLPEFSINDTTVCYGDSAFYDFSNNGIVSYLWNNSDTIATRYISTTGIHWLEVTDVNGCSYRDSMQFYYDSIPVLSLQNDTSICNYDSLIVDISHPSIISYLWNDLDINPVKILHNGTYFVTVIGVNGCEKTDTITVNYTPTLSLLLSDTAVCINDSIELMPVVSNPISQYLWSTSETSVTIFSKGGNYRLDVVDIYGCSAFDSANVIVNPLPLPLIYGDTLSCDSNQITLSVLSSNPYLDYNWNTGEKTSSVNVYHGIFFVEVIDENGCNGSDTITIISDNRPVAPNKSYEICIGDTILLDATSYNTDSYIWSTGEQTSTLRANLIQNYEVYLNNRCGTDTGMFVITEKQLPNFDLGADTTFCLNEFIEFKLNVAPSDIIWNFNDINIDSNNYFIKIYNDGKLIVEISQGRCVVRDSINLSTQICIDSFDIHVPNTFTPDGDGKNDKFLPLSAEGNEYDYYKFLIFNRWGQLIFESEKPGEGWDGMYKNEISKTDTYVWKIEYSPKETTSKVQKIGHVNLLR